MLPNCGRSVEGDKNLNCGLAVSRATPAAPDLQVQSAVAFRVDMARKA